MKLKVYSAKELGLDKSNESQFQVRQKVFHIFGIPFFSLGRLYVRENKGKYHEVPIQIEQILKSKEIKTPINAFLGAFVLPLIFLAFYLTNLGLESEKHQEFIRQNNIYISSQIDKINNPKKNDLYLLTTEKNDNYFVQVNDFNDEQILLKIPTVYIEHYSPYKTFSETVGNNYKYEWISKELLKTAINDNPRKEYDFEKVAVNKLLGNNKFSMKVVRQGKKTIKIEDREELINRMRRDTKKLQKNK